MWGQHLFVYVINCDLEPNVAIVPMLPFKREVYIYMYIWQYLYYTYMCMYNVGIVLWVDI